MRAVLTAVIAAIEAAAVALVGMAVVVVPAVLLWVVTFELAADPGQVFVSAIGVWFLAHLSPLEFGVSAETAVGLGQPQAAFMYPISLAPLGLTLLTAALAARSGWRFGGRGGTGAAGVLGGAAGFAAVAAMAAPFAAGVLARPIWAAALIAALIYGAGSVGGFLLRAVRDEHQWLQRLMRSMQRGISSVGLPGDAAFPMRLVEVLRLAGAAVLALLVIAAAGLAIAIIAGYVQIVTLSQSLQFDAFGATVVFLLQLALLPVFVIWAASWLTGAGFVVGIGSSATPFEALLGPMPALPLFGAIPQGWAGAGALAPALVVLAGACIGALFARRPVLRRASWAAALSIAATAGVLVGLACAGAGALAVGAIGPERLAETGPNPWLFGGLAAAEIGGGLLLGVTAGRLDGGRLRAVIPGMSASRDAGGAGAEDTDGQVTVPLDSAVRPLKSARGTGVALEDLPDDSPEIHADDLGDPAGSIDPVPDPASGRTGESDQWAADRRASRRHETGQHATEPFETGQPTTGQHETEQHETEQQETEEQETEELRLDPREVELFDIEQHEVDSSDATRSEPRRPEPAQDPSTSVDLEALDEETLLRAYSWNADRPESEVPREAEKRRGWRFPR